MLHAWSALPWQTVVHADHPVHCSAWLQHVKHTEWDTCPGGCGRVWCLTFRDNHSAPRRPAQYTTFTCSSRRRRGLTWAGAWWPGLVSHYTDSYTRSSRRLSEWVDTGQALQCWYHYDFDTTRYDEHSGPFCTHSLAQNWCRCRPLVPSPGHGRLESRRPCPGSQCAAW